MYLGRTLTGFDGRTHRMSGVLPVDFAMDREFLAIAYVTAETRADSPLGPTGTRVRGQEFHQSRIVDGAPGPALYDLERTDGVRSRDGHARRNVAASYVHLHLASAPNVAAHLLHAARAHRAD
jgi:cobyrinic acid a,c-diamide synthase